MLERVSCSMGFPKEKKKVLIFLSDDHVEFGRIREGHWEWLLESFADYWEELEPNQVKGWAYINYKDKERGSSQKASNATAANDLISRQAAIDITMQYCPDDDGSCSKADRDIRKLLDDLENMPSTQQWIPCSERPPEESGDYLVTVVHHSDELWVEVDQFDNTNGSWWHYMDDVIAWMPRPKPYQEG